MDKIDGEIQSQNEMNPNNDPYEQDLMAKEDCLDVDLEHRAE